MIRLEIEGLQGRAGKRLVVVLAASGLYRVVDGGPFGGWSREGGRERKVR